MNNKYYVYVKTQIHTFTICALASEGLASFAKAYKCGENPMLNGKVYSLNNLLEIHIYEIDMDEHSEEEINRFKKSAYYKSDTFISVDVLEKIGKEITDEYISTVFDNNVYMNKEQSKSSKEVFIVHGRDIALKEMVARFLEKMNIRPVILNEKENNGRTIIEKLVNQQVGYAIVLYTPCDECQLPNNVEEKRARQNVLFEHGYFIGKLGRENTCTIVDESVSLPSDVVGLGYIKYENSDSWKIYLAKELKKAGYDIDLNKL